MTFGASKRAGPALITALLLGLVAGCSEPEVVLPGAREALEPNPATPVAQAVPIAVPAATLNSDAAQFEGSPAFRTQNPRAAQTLTLAWSAPIGQGDSRKHRITADPVVLGGAIFTLDAQARVTATSIEGARLWQRDFAGGAKRDVDTTGGGIAAHAGKLFVSLGEGRLLALDAADGALLWEQQLDASGASRPLAVDDLVYVTSGDDTGWAIDTDTGRVVWQVSASNSVSNVLGGPSPVLADDLVLFAFGSGEVQAVFRQGGLRRWDSSVLGQRRGRALAAVGDITGTPFVHNGVVYAANQSGRMVAVNAASGKRLWTIQEGAIDPVLPVGGSVFLINDRNELLRLDAQTGETIWTEVLPNFTAKRPRRATEVFAHHGPVMAGGRLLVASGDGQLRSYAPEDGRLLDSFAVPGAATTRPVVAAGTVLLVSRSGMLHAYR